MLTVSATDLGTPEQVWLEHPALTELPPLVWQPGQPLVVVAPHPDDEVLGVGGLLRVAALLGSPIRIVAVTDGEASHPGSSWTAADLAARRRDESVTALERLGLPSVDLVRCELPDGDVAGHEARLGSILGELLDPTSLCLATWRHDGHPDHDATGRAAVAATHATGSTLLEYPVWAWHWATPQSGLPLDDAWRLDLGGSDVVAKRHAIEAFTSQIRPLGPGPADRAVLPPAVRARFERRFEIYLGSATP